MVPTKIDTHLAKESKVVIINDDKQQKEAFLVDLLADNSANEKQLSNGLFRYGTLTKSNKTANLYDCSEVI